MEIIGKPFTMEKLAVKIREMIERHADPSLGALTLDALDPLCAIE
jgi:hypothetical protein